jgi:hypothetical protein
VGHAPLRSLAGLVLQHLGELRVGAVVLNRTAWIVGAVVLGLLAIGLVIPFVLMDGGGHHNQTPVATTK